MARANATKRRKFTNAGSIPSGFNRPVDAIPRPRPHMTFSLNRGNNAAPNLSKTTRRREFEPKSMTPIRSAIASGSRSDMSSAHDKPRVTSPERLATAGQARIGHEIGMGRKALLICRYAFVYSARRQAPALKGVAKVRHHDFVQHLAVYSGVFYRHQSLYAPVEIARHPIGGADEYLCAIRRQLVAVAETNNSLMLEKAPDDALDPDIVGEARDARPQTADAAHDKINAHPRLRSLIEKIDDRRVDEGIHLCPYLGRLALFRVVELGFDELDQPRSQRERRHRDLLQAGRAGIACHEVEQPRGVPA